MSAKQKYGLGNYNVTEVSHYPLKLSDGIHLSVKLYIPTVRDKNNSFPEKFSVFNNSTFDVPLIKDEDQSNVLGKAKYPVILEYLPYCKDMYTSERDYNRHSWWASYGFVSMRVEMRGSGASEGYYYGEYLPQEQSDCSEVLQWLEGQAWFNGKAGMYGKSWGGFNGLQQAYKEADSSPLKTAISLYSTDNRYTDDIHYEGGCVVGNGMLSWAGEMFARDAIPPHPRVFTEKKAWLEAWKQRLEKETKSKASTWLNQQLPGPFWEQGSVDVDYEKITIPVLVIGGLEDGYTTAAERMARKLNKESKVIIGPWCHDWPDYSSTGRLIDYLTLCLNWFSHHLKGTDIDPNDKCTAWPRLQCTIRSSFKPSDMCVYYDPSKPDLGPNIYGFNDWISKKGAVDTFMNNCIEGRDVSAFPFLKVVYITQDNKAVFSQPELEELGDIPLKITPNPLQGARCGIWSPWGSPALYAGDQATSIANSLSFYSQPLKEPLIMIGPPKFVLKITSTSWKRVYISVKINDMDPDGVATKVTRCQFDLNFLRPISDEGPTRTYVLSLLFAAHQFKTGHKLVISIAPNAFPMMWPSCSKADVFIHPEGCKFMFQTETQEYLDNNLRSFDSPRPLFPMPMELETQDTDSSTITHLNGKVVYETTDCPGIEHLHHTSNVWYEKKTRETFEADEKVTYAVATVDKVYTSIYDNLNFTDCKGDKVGVKVVTSQRMYGDSDVYTLEEDLSVTYLPYLTGERSERGEEIFKKSWTDVIPRQDHKTWASKYA